jgi:hypothetical protein
MESNPLAVPAIDPELLKRIYDQLLQETGAEVLLNTQLCSVESSDEGEVSALVTSSKGGLRALVAKVYVDCTGDGDLAAWAGAEFEKGDQTGQMQPATLCFVIANVEEQVLAEGPRIHFHDPESPIHKAIHSGKYPDIIDLHSCNIKIGPGTFGFNTGHVYDVDNTDPANVSKALSHGRRMAAQYRDAFAEYHPAFADAFLVATGGLLGARETRRIMGDYVLTIEDYLEHRSFRDEICRNAYGIDVHGPKKKSLSMTKKTLDEIRSINQRGTKKLAKGESLGVPYRCLTPRGIRNVLVAGRCISTDRQVNGSVRIMACCLNTGEAAGVAAAMTTLDREEGSVHDVDTEELRRRLKEYGAYLPETSAG